jgi:hypothetical protein
MSIFLSEIQASNREKVRGSISVAQATDNERFVGYSFRESGEYNTTYIEPGLNNLIKFICSNDRDKLVTDSGDNSVLCTIAEYVDICVESFNIQTILPSLLEVQKNMKEM